MMQDAKLSAAGRKGEEAIDVDVSEMLVGDWLTIIVGYSGAGANAYPSETIKLVKTGEGNFTLIAGKAWTDVEAGEMAAHVAASGQNIAIIGFTPKRDPKADLAKAESGEFTS
jgi:ABC-type enterochelin transport system ATPase subunit